jgi:DNA-binding MltR family transcriptional regulator
VPSRGRRNEFDEPGPNDHDDVKEFYDLSPDRGLAITLAAIVDNRLTSIVKLMMRHDAPALINELSQPNGPLGNFRTKIHLAYLLRIIDKPLHEDLMTVLRIRNKFAHDLSIKSFDQEPIRGWIKGMRVQSTLKTLREGKIEGPDQKWVKTFQRAMRVQISTMQGTFKETLRFLIHHLHLTEEQCQEIVKKHPDPRFS